MLKKQGPGYCKGRSLIRREEKSDQPFSITHAQRLDWTAMLSRPLSSTDLDLILRQTQTLWEPMRGQRLFITGGTGFFGCWLVESFCHINRELSLNANATVLTRSPAHFIAKAPHLATDPHVRLLAGDVKDFEFPKSGFPFVIHAATEASARQAAEAP